LREINGFEGLLNLKIERKGGIEMIKKSFYELLIGTVLLTSITVSQAMAAELFVSSTGTGTTCTQADPCLMQTALGKAIDGDIIYSAGGTYTGTGDAVITIDKSITLYGGWNKGASGAIVKAPGAYPSVVDGENLRRGIYVNGDVSTTIEGFIITHGHDYRGGGIYVEKGTPVISGNIITQNTALWYGGGIYINSGTATITDNDIINNSAVYGGGGLEFKITVTVTLNGNYIADNQAQYGGGFEADKADITLIGNTIVRNQSDSACIVSGPGGHNLGAMNNVVANNQGTGFTIYEYDADLAHNTIVHNGTNAVWGDVNAHIALKNNVIAGHPEESIGVPPGVTVSASNNLFWGNHADPITGTNAVLGDPHFINPTGGDYRIGLDSAAIDHGIDASVTTDIDGNPRDATPDIGAYEYMVISLLTPSNEEAFTGCSYYDLPTFGWFTGETFKSFEIRFSLDQDFGSIPVKVKLSGTVTETEMKSSTLKKILLMPGASGGLVYWRVVGTKPNKATEISDVRSIVVWPAQAAGSPAISSTSKGSSPTLSWLNNCNKKFKVWFGNDSSFTKKKALTFSVTDPTENTFTTQLTASQWTAIRKLVGDVSGSAIYWKVESWDGLNRHAQTDVMSFVLTD
jgi:hypothetical protein